MNDARREFSMLASREPVPLARGALLIAKEEYPDLNVDHYVDRLAELAREAEPIVNAGNDTVEKVQLLSHFLFEQKGFEGNRDAVPALTQVLEREPEALVRSHAAWALGELGGRTAHHALERAREGDLDAQVVEEACAGLDRIVA